MYRHNSCDHNKRTTFITYVCVHSHCFNLQLYGVSKPIEKY